MDRSLVILLITFQVLISVSASEWKTLNGSPPLLVAHRGEKVLLPEHTLPGYRVASILGADFVEPDLCLTKDDIFVCHHDTFLTEDTTDVGNYPEFDHLKTVDDKGGKKWFIQNFTLEELQRLRVRQKAVGIRPQEFDGLYGIPTFQEYLDLVHEMNHKLQRPIGVIPELKEPAFHNANRTAHFMESSILEILSQNGYPLKDEEENCTTKQGEVKIKCPPLIIQSFEFKALEHIKLKTHKDKVQLMMLVEENVEVLTYTGLKGVSHVAQHLGIWKEFLHVGVEKLIELQKKSYNKTVIGALGGFIPASEIPTVVHNHSMSLGIYTIYDSREPSFRIPTPDEAGRKFTKKDELSYFFNLGVDNVFVENVAESREILRDFQRDLELVNCTTPNTSGASGATINTTYLLFIAAVVFVTSSFPVFKF